MDLLEGGRWLNKFYYQNISVEILYEDNHLLVIKKPINVLVQKDKTNDIDLNEILKSYMKEKYNKQGNVYLGVVHRLDRPVGGVMIFTKTSKAAARISEQIRKGSFIKKYLAILDGNFKGVGLLEDYLIKDKAKNIVKVTERCEAGSKKAILKYKTISCVNNLTLVEIELITGRSHQIRVQFSNIGFSLLGDVKYGEKKEKMNICLWSNEVILTHPITKKTIAFKVLPEYRYPWHLFSLSSV